MTKILYIDMDNVLVDFPSAFPHVDPTLLDQHADNKDDIAGIFSLMTPMPGAVEAFAELAALFETYIRLDLTLGQPNRLVRQAALGQALPGTTGLQAADSYPSQAPQCGGLPHRRPHQERCRSLRWRTHSVWLGAVSRLAGRERLPARVCEMRPRLTTGTCDTITSRINPKVR